MSREPALETERSQDGKARFPSSEQRAGCPKRTSGDGTWATPVTPTNAQNHIETIHPQAPSKETGQ